MTLKAEDHLYSEPPPSFGHEMLSQFFFEPGFINLNHGSYGSLPRPVSAAVEHISLDIEKNPDRFMRHTALPLLAKAREGVAKLLGANVDECVFVPNATHGVNTVLRNLIWSKDDVIVETTVTYGAVSRTIQYLADVPPSPQISTFLLQFPTDKEDVLSRFRAYLKSIERIPGRKVVAVVDALVANPGVLLPWKELVKICKEEDVISVVDAAHAIGQQTGINLNKADPDFWISNCHKWLYAKRGCAVLYVPKRLFIGNQHLIKTSLPTSHSYISPQDPLGGPEAPNFIAQFGKNGTIDYAPYLSVPYALKFREWIGGEEKLNKYCHELAISGGRKLAELLGTQVMDEDGEFTANMVNVEIPLKTEGSLETISSIQNTLLDDWNMFAVPYFHNGKWWVRISTQIYNEISDFEKLGEALNSICKGLNEMSSK